MTYKVVILCDSPNCSEESVVPEPGSVPPEWILLKRVRGTKSFCSIPCLLDEIRGSVKPTNEPIEAKAEVKQPSIEEAMKKPIPKEEYDNTRRKILSRHRTQ